MNYIVGDIHGHFSRLKTQLDTFFDYGRDTLYQVGDLVDRGPESEQVLDWLDKPWFKAVLGNHEDMIVQSKNNPTMQYLSEVNGGEWFFRLDPYSQDLIREKLRELPLSRTFQSGGLKVGIIHADPPSDWNGPFHKEASIWGRHRFNYADTTLVKNIDMVYVGHTPTKYKVLGNVHYIDSGAWYHNKPFEFYKV